ncbi:hypothetical protein TYRP_013395 [Tyrophagus putrescentiae]|nr:hypothetical protein TYRP_013395 [Tyrophagus putrescentiae]
MSASCPKPGQLTERCMCAKNALFFWVELSASPCVWNADFGSGYLRCCCADQALTLLDIVPPKAVAEEEEAFGACNQQDSEQFEWRLYTIYLIRTNAVRLLRYMLREEYDAKSATELFTH